jgi:hypothetical protein
MAHQAQINRLRGKIDTLDEEKARLIERLVPGSDNEIAIRGER